MLVVLLSAVALETNFFIDDTPVTGRAVAAEDNYYPTPGNIPPKESKATVYSIDSNN